MRSTGKLQDAAAEFEQILQKFPRDREVQRQFGQTVYALGRFTEARSAFEALLEIDPNDAGAYQFLAPIYKSELRFADAERASSLYLLWRDDPLTDLIANRFFAANPNWAEERVLAHSHGEYATSRPTLTGRFAAPDR
jgi:tetratricopeptide (TPR) repeat protein